MGKPGLLVSQFFIMDSLTEKAKKVIYEAITPKGILASASDIDNYARIWSRDSMMTGLAGWYIQDIKIINGFKDSVITLAEYQHETGMIPSNVSVSPNHPPGVSYGSLAGRTDATLWWLIGTLTLMKNDPDFYREKVGFLLPKIEKALFVLQVWEYNGRGLIYSPLGGNWADEYVTSGYTLYDNVLYGRALEMSGEILQSKRLSEKASQTKKLIRDNYDNQMTDEGSLYHKTAFEKRKMNLKPYFSASLAPNGYDQVWDMAGNAMALLTGLYSDILPLTRFLEKQISNETSGLLPVFYPVIQKEDHDWHLLEENYAYNFKNKPFQFHNGGFWPIFAGWLVLGLRKYKQHELADRIVRNYEEVLSKSLYTFYEYHDIRNGQGRGVEKLCFSAAGYLFMTVNDQSFENSTIGDR